MKSPGQSRLLGVWRVFVQDLFQLLESFSGIVLVFIVPPLLLGIVGQLSVVAPPFQVLVAGSPTEADREVYDELVALLGDLSTVRVGTSANESVDPLAELDSLRLDLLVNLEGDEPAEWIMYTAASTRSRLASVRQFAAGLERALGVIEDWSAERDATEPEGIAAETDRWATELGALGSFTPRQMMVYYPRAPSIPPASASPQATSATTFPSSHPARPSAPTRRSPWHSLGSRCSCLFRRCERMDC